MSRFIVSITETDEETGSETQRYQQTVDYVDIHAVISAVNNSTPQPKRQRALRSDAGKSRVNRIPDDLTRTPVERE